MKRTKRERVNKRETGWIDKIFISLGGGGGKTYFQETTERKAPLGGGIYIPEERGEIYAEAQRKWRRRNSEIHRVTCEEERWG